MQKVFVLTQPGLLPYDKSQYILTGLLLSR